VDVLDCYTRAKNSCVTKFPQTRDYVRSLLFLGWPVALPGMGVGGVARPGADPQFGSARPVLECFPSPFNPSATIRYSLDGRTRAVLEVFDVLGRRVIRLVDQVQAPGVHEVVWNGLDARGLDVSSGVYFVRMVTGEKAATTKIVMAR